MKNTYNIIFSLGDPGHDGHGTYEDFHITSNYSAKEIDDAYKKATEIIGINFTEEICAEFGDNCISKEICAELNKKYKIIPENYMFEGEVEDLDPENYIIIYFNIVKIILPNIIYNYRNLNEDYLYTLNGRAYGLYY